MSLVSQMLNNLNVACIVSTKDGKILSSTIDSEEFVNKCVQSIREENNIFHFDNKFYSCGKEDDGKQILYWAQDISKVYEELGKDKLTKLYNRVIAEPLIDEYILHSFEKEEPFSIVMCDIDHFKNINDTYGHAKGDEVLSNISRTLLNSFRTQDFYDFFENNLRRNSGAAKDILCRYGGEEFLIIVKNITLENTLKKIESIRELIEDNGVLTMSFGVYHCDPKDYDLKLDKNNIEAFRNSMIKGADYCLYQSKENGRNQINYMDPYTGQIISNKSVYIK